LEMPSGTGKTVSLLSLVVSYKAVRHHSTALHLAPRYSHVAHFLPVCLSFLVAACMCTCL
jgi:hypothetical protein